MPVEGCTMNQEKPDPTEIWEALCKWMGVDPWPVADLPEDACIVDNAAYFVAPDMTDWKPSQVPNTLRDWVEKG